MKKTTLFVLVVLTVLCALFVSCSAENDGTQVINLSVDGLVRSKAAGVASTPEISVALASCHWYYTVECVRGIGWTDVAQKTELVLGSTSSVQLSVGTWKITVNGYKEENKGTKLYSGTTVITVDSNTSVTTDGNSSYSSSKLNVKVEALDKPILKKATDEVVYLYDTTNDEDKVYSLAPVNSTITIKWEIKKSSDSDYTQIWVSDSNDLTGYAAGSYTIKATILGEETIPSTVENGTSTTKNNEYGSVETTVTIVNGYTYALQAKVAITKTSIKIDGLELVTEESEKRSFVFGNLADTVVNQ